MVVVATEEEPALDVSTPGGLGLELLERRGEDQVLLIEQVALNTDQGFIKPNLTSARAPE